MTAEIARVAAEAAWRGACQVVGGDFGVAGKAYAELEGAQQAAIAAIALARLQACGWILGTHDWLD